MNPFETNCGQKTVPNTTYTRLYYGVQGASYAMSPMWSYHKDSASGRGLFTASWKVAPQDEDQAGQLVQYSQSFDGVTWTPTDGTGILFPNMSTNSNPAHLFAEPGVILNDHLYAAASPTQFCLYPDQYAPVLLLRRVYTNATGTFGPVFWASATIPAGFEEASALNNVVTVTQMDATTQADVAVLLGDPYTAPCANQADGTTKCEWCEGGCQPWNATTNVTSLENERSHYTIPGTAGGGGDGSGQVDVILYRSHLRLLHASVRTGVNSTWSSPVPTNITDDVVNFNAGHLPDGRVYLVSNACVNIFRDPLFVSTSSDGWHFDATSVVASCEQDIFKSPTQPWGCVQRIAGGAKEGGIQYAQALALTDPDRAGLWVIASLNKEDIWVFKVPFTF